MGASAGPSLTADQVVERMVKMNQQRAEALKTYTSMRVYHLEYYGVKHMRAEVVVKMTYHWPDRKEFTVVSENGSKMLRNRVLKRLLEAEVEAMREENRKQAAIHPDNYEFTASTYRETPLGQFYVLEATPRIKTKFSFRGQIWVDGKDFAIVRIEGEPAKSPSWWTKQTDFRISYQKVGDSWLPARNETATHVRFLGRALLTIEYKDYQLAEAHDLPFAPPA